MPYETIASPPATIEYRVRTASGKRSDASLAWTEKSDIEIIAFDHGYGMIGRCELLWGGRFDECPYANGTEVQILVHRADDDSDYVCWWGHMKKIVPSGQKSEGAVIECLGLEDYINRVCCTWNGVYDYAYNEKSTLDLNSPNRTSWRLGEVIADILEHNLGPYWDTENYDGSLVIPHHSPEALKYCPMTRATRTIAGADRAYRYPLTGTYEGPSFRWYEHEVRRLDLWDVVDEVKLVGANLWDAIVSLVEKSSGTGVYLDYSCGNPSLTVNIDEEPFKDADGYPTVLIRFHDWSVSDHITFQCGEVGKHILDPNAKDYPDPGVPTQFRRPIVKDMHVETSLEGVKTHIIIEGEGKVQESANIWLAPAWIDSSGEVADVNNVGTLWKVWDHSFLPLLEAELDGAEGSPAPVMPPWSQKLVGPVLIVDGQYLEADPNVLDVQIYHDSGLVKTSRSFAAFYTPGATPPSSLRLHSKYLASFRVEAGPGGDAWDNYEYLAQLVIHDEDLMHQSVPGLELYSVTRQYLQRPQPYYKIVRVTGLQNTDGRTYAPGLKDDTAMMQGLASAMLARMGDELMTATVTVDLRLPIYEQVDPNTGVYYWPYIGPQAYQLLECDVHFGGLDKWDDVELQILNYRVTPAKQEIEYTLSTAIDRAINWPYAEWKRRWLAHHLHQRTFLKLQEYSADMNKRNAGHTRLGARNDVEAIKAAAKQAAAGETDMDTERYRDEWKIKYGVQKGLGGDISQVVVPSSDQGAGPE